MRLVTSVQAMQRSALAWKRAGVRISFVLTMGYLHEGHMSLVREARKRVGSKGVVVVSIYVNPTQFAPTEDLSKYPRDLQRDLQLCRAEGVDLVFAPTDVEMYPAGKADAFSTFVVEEKLSKGMEGASRPTHFRGVTTVVAKLFNIVQPDVAVFGAKDFQQAAVVRRMVRDLNFPIEIVVAETRREKDGLAMSSRNKFLNPVQRVQAVVLNRMISEARRLVQARKRAVNADWLRGKLTAMLEGRTEARLDYVEFFDADSLAPVKKVSRESHMALAVFIGNTRLIDNGSLGERKH